VPIREGVGGHAGVTGPRTYPVLDGNEGVSMDQSSAPAASRAAMPEITGDDAYLLGENVGLHADSEFHVSLRGYDRRQVDTYVSRTQRRIDELRAELAVVTANEQALAGRVDELVERLSLCSCNPDVPSSGVVGARLRRIIDLAMAEAEEMRTRAESESRTIREEAEQMRTRAESESHALRVEAQELRYRADAEADSARAQAEAESHALRVEAQEVRNRADAEADSARARAEADSRALWEEAERVLAEARQQAEQATRDFEITLAHKRSEEEAAATERRAAVETWVDGQVGEARSTARRLIENAAAVSGQVVASARWLVDALGAHRDALSEQLGGVQRRIEALPAIEPAAAMAAVDRPGEAAQRVRAVARVATTIGVPPGDAQPSPAWPTNPTPAGGASAESSTTTSTTTSTEAPARESTTAPADSARPPRRPKMRRG
jgi:cell division septum initiation protein DivIVA